MKPAPQMKSFGDWLLHVFFGICMGTADLVPGVSGGTMAFVMGFYEDLITSVKSISFIRPKQVCWSFLSALIFGVAIAFVTFAKTIHEILGDKISRTYLYAAFFGLIIASIFYCLKHIKKWHFRYFVTLGLGATLGFALTTRNDTQESPLYNVSLENSWVVPLANYDSENEQLLNVNESTLSAMLSKGYIEEDTQVFHQGIGVTANAGQFVQHIPFHWVSTWLILCGMIAVSAMLLPGVSGSYMLVILGMYAVVIGALADLLDGFKHFTFLIEPFLILANLGVGMLIGALLFSRVISWLLDHRHQSTISLLIGFMIGALPVVWPFWSYQYLLNPLKLEKGPQIDPIARILPELSPQLWGVIGVAALSFTAVLILEAIAGKTRKAA